MEELQSMQQNVDNASQPFALSDLSIQQEPQTSRFENEDSHVNVYQSIIDQQQAQIDALMAQTERLNGQITQMVQNGVQFGQTQTVAQTQSVAQPQPMMQNTTYQAPMQQLNTPALSDNADYSLDSLAKEIGKPREGF